MSEFAGWISAERKGYPGSRPAGQMKASSPFRSIWLPGGSRLTKDLLRVHQETYRTFWRWSDAAVDHAMSKSSLHTVFGWTIHIGEDSNPRSLRNYPMQGNGAEMLRLACCIGTERGIEVCAPVHDVNRHRKVGHDRRPKVVHA